MAKTFSKQTVNGVPYLVKDAEARENIEKINTESDVYALVNIPWKKMRENLVIEFKEGKYPGGGIGTKIAFGTASGYNCVKVAIPESGRVIAEAIGSNNFFRLTDYNDIVIAASYSDYFISETEDGAVVQFPEGAKYAYLCSQNYSASAVVYEGDDYPTTNKRGKVEIPDLYSDGKYVEDMAQYSSVNGKRYNSSASGLKDARGFAGGVIDAENNTITISNINGGAFIPAYPKAYNTVIRLKIRCTFTTSSLTCQVHYIRESDQRDIYVNLGNIVSGEETIKEFDAAYYNVYAGTTGVYQFLLQCNDAGASGVVTVEEITIYEADAFNSSPYYDEQFPQMMNKVFAGIDDAKQSGGGAKNILVGPDGKKYLLAVGENAQIVLIPVIPNKVLFCGNSLLLGMNTGASNPQYVYGMCATQPSKDYCHLVMDEIEEKNESVTYNRIHGAVLEQLENTTDYDALWSSHFAASFTSDLDLIVIQLGDNVNNEDRRYAFQTNINSFLADVREASPNARIIWVFGWFNNEDVQNTILGACQKWGIEYLNIQALNTTENQGHSGQTYIDGSGNTQTVSDRWITHPGDNGFAAIADEIISKLDM